MEPSPILEFIKGYHIVQEDNALKVVERIHSLLKTVSGLSYCYSDFHFSISVENSNGMQGCTIDIYSNRGAHKKPRIIKAFTSEMISDDEQQQYVINYVDTTRYFDKLFGYVMENYSAEYPVAFSASELTYGLYCPDYSEYDGYEEEEEYPNQSEIEQKEAEEEQERLFQEYCKTLR
jgi:hypothetical protein